MPKKDKKNWVYIKGHYRKNGVWVPAHLSLWRQIIIPLCAAGGIWMAILFLLFGLSIVFIFPVFLIILCFCIVIGHSTIRISIMNLIFKKRTKARRHKLYEELCPNLKQAEVFNNLIDLDKLDGNLTQSRAIEDGPEGNS